MTSWLSRKACQAKPSRYDEPGVDERIVARLGVAQFVEEAGQTADSAGIEAAREVPGGSLRAAVAPARSSRFARRARAEDAPPQLVVGRLVDEHVILARKEPGQRAGGELVATIAEQIGGGSAHDEVHLELGVAMRAGPNLADRMSDDAPVQLRPKPEILDHRKKR